MVEERRKKKNDLEERRKTILDVAAGKVSDISPVSSAFI
jgi:hypothetical protein